MKQLIYFLLLVFVASCGNTEIVDAPWNVEPVPVVYSVISPNESVELILKQTYNSNYPSLKNPYSEAKVFICGADSNWVELLRIKADTCVFKDVQQKIIIEKGKTYSLKLELSNRTVRAQTTVPLTNAIINDVVCYNINSVSGAVNISGTYVPATFNYLSVHYTLPSVKDFGFALSAFDKQQLGLTDLSGNNYVSNEFPCPEDSSSFILKLTTMDANLKKYQLALAIANSQGQPQVSIVEAVIGTFGGVLPQFNNIVNGVGIFGSSVTDSKRVGVINKTN